MHLVAKHLVHPISAKELIHFGHHLQKKEDLRKSAQLAAKQEHCTGSGKIRNVLKGASISVTGLLNTVHRKIKGTVPTGTLYFGKSALLPVPTKTSHTCSHENLFTREVVPTKNPHCLCFFPQKIAVTDMKCYDQ